MTVEELKALYVGQEISLEENEIPLGEGKSYKTFKIVEIDAVYVGFVSAVKDMGLKPVVVMPNEAMIANFDPSRVVAYVENRVGKYFIKIINNG